MTIRIKAIEQYFHVVLLIMLNKVVLSFESVDQILKYMLHLYSIASILIGHFCDPVFFFFF